jgi:hypothetical protein
VDGRVDGPIQGGEVVLKSQAHVVGDIQHQSLAIEKGAYFEGRSMRSTSWRNQQSFARERPISEPVKLQEQRPAGCELGIGTTHHDSSSLRSEGLNIQFQDDRLVAATNSIRHSR